MRRRQKRYSKKPLITFLLTAALIISVFLYKAIQPVIISYAVSVAETAMLNTANEAIVKVLKANSVDYGDIVTLTHNEEGYVTSLEINVIHINSLKSLISNEMEKIIGGKENYKISIPVGTFLGNSYTNGLGPKITFNMQMTTTCYVNFSHEFKSAGINQVLHIVNVDIDVVASFVIIGNTKSFSVSTSAIAAQTVIVGKSPDAFTNVVESESDNTGGLINDYGAIAE